MFWHQCAWQTSVPMCIWHTQAPAVLVPFHFQLPLWCVVPTPQSQCTAITVIYCYSPHSHHAGTSVYLDDNTAVSPVMKGQGWCNFISNAHTGLATIFICVCLSKGKQMQTCQCQKEPWYFLFLFFCFVFIFTMMILFLWHASWYYGISFDVKVKPCMKMTGSTYSYCVINVSAGIQFCVFVQCWC